MADLSKIIIPDGTEFDIKDATARTDIASKQDTLVSGTNIKTINGNSILGSGDITISGGGTQNTWYGVCPTGATTQAKIVTTTTGDFTLEIGNMVRVKFNNAQTYNGGITLNVDGTGAKSAMRNGTTATTRYFYLAGEVVDFVYDGTYFIAVNEGIATTTYYGVTKLSNSTASTSTSLAATANSVKLAYDLANSKSVVSVSQTLTSGTEIGSVTVDGTQTKLYAPSGSGGSTVSVSQIATTGDNIADITVDGTTTNVYNGVTVLTDAEIEEAVEDAEIMYSIVISYDAMSGANVYDDFNNIISSSKAGEVCYIKGGTITGVSSTPVVEFTNNAGAYYFVMPMSNLAITVTITGGGSND